MRTFAELLTRLFSASRKGEEAGLCNCACHITGIYGGTICPLTCPCFRGKFDGCHRCGCPGTTCPLGECNTSGTIPSLNRQPAAFNQKAKQ